MIIILFSPCDCDGRRPALAVHFRRLPGYVTGKNIKLGKELALVGMFDKEKRPMVTYVILMKLTDQGAKNIKDAPARVQAGIKGMEALGGKVLGFYLTMGDYDYVAIGEAPNDEAVAVFLLSLGSLGNVHTTTLKAFSVEKFAELVKMLP